MRWKTAGSKMGLNFKLNRPRITVVKGLLSDTVKRRKFRIIFKRIYSIFSRIIFKRIYSIFSRASEMGTRKALKDWVCHFNFRWWVNHFRSWLYYFRFDPNFRWKQMFKGQISWNSRQGNFSVVFDVFFLSAEFQTEPLAIKLPMK